MQEKAHNLLSFLRTFSRKGVEFVCKHAITAKSYETQQHREGFRTKMGDLIAHTGISPRDKGGSLSERKSMMFKDLDKTSARKEEKSGLEFEKLHTFAAQREAKHTKTPPLPWNFP